MAQRKQSPGALKARVAIEAIKKVRAAVIREKTQADQTRPEDRHQTDTVSCFFPNFSANGLTTGVGNCYAVDAYKLLAA